MGNTTRRQPISFGIPAAPDYKFLNITDFAGLNITDNPFTAKANTASDALNVYVDENNALTTRPRLEKIEELLLKINQPSMKLIDVVNTKFGVLVHGLVEDDPMMYLVSSDRVYKLRQNNVYELDVPKNKFLTLEKDNYIYLIGNDYLWKVDSVGVTTVLANKVSGFSTAYTPIRRSINATSNKEIKGANIEPLNLFNDKYIDAYFWDGLTDIDYLNSWFINKYENKYCNVQKFEILPSTDSYNPKSLRKYIPKATTDKPDAKSFYSTYDGSDKAILVRTELSSGETVHWNVINPTEDLPYYKDTLHVDSTDDGNIIAYCYSKNNEITKESGKTAGGVFVLRDSKITKLLVDDNDVFESKYYTNWYGLSPTMNNDYRIHMSSDGNVIVTYSNRDILKFTYDKTTELYDLTRFPIDTTTYECVGVNLSRDGKIIIAKLKKLSETDYTKFHKLITIKNDVVENLTDKEDYYYAATLSRSGNYLCVKSHKSTEGDSSYLYKQFHTNNEKTKIKLNSIPMVISEQNDKIYTSSGYYVIANDWEYVEKDLTNKHGDNNDGFIMYASKDALYTSNKAWNGRDKYIEYIRLTHYDYGNHEPLLYLTKSMMDSDSEYNKWKERRQYLLNPELMTVFDNNIWFSANNKLFHTTYNDISYIPMSNYYELGDDASITGFNLANDNLLIVYKTNKLYQISPTTINNIYTYLLEETKNTVGNEAFGSTIVTTLTERPLQITRDGIFALNQLKNVQSSDRISVLISEHINKKWLVEKDELIYNCTTLNRLYWTYFILRDDELKITKIYLLDNRTSSWYYWELPIIVMSAFVDNNITKFVDIDGNLYKLETKDAFNKYNPEITEYYDDGQKLIKWYWQSQILPLGTINYSKRLVNTTFIVSDTEMSDEYGLNYSFKIYRKLVSESNTTTVSDNLNYVQSVTKKTMIPRFNFIQIKLSNIEEEDNEAFNNNKFRLIGLGLKYVLLEGLY